MAAILTIAALLAAVRFGWVLAGPVAAAATALALLAMPLIWRLLPTLRIDLPRRQESAPCCWRSTGRRSAGGPWREPSSA